VHRISVVVTRAVALSLVVGVTFFLQSVGASVADRPGDAKYTPTKLEWAALELQATYGNTNWTRDNPIAITFLPKADGKTILCLFQYAPEVTAQSLKSNRDTEKLIFDKYVASRNWSWLRLEMQQQVVPSQHR
jgi:hypothetical protein